MSTHARMCLVALCCFAFAVAPRAPAATNAQDSLLCERFAHD